MVQRRGSTVLLPLLTASAYAGNTYAPEGGLYWGQGQPLELPAEQPCLLQMAICSALCNDSSLTFAAGVHLHCRLTRVSCLCVCSSVLCLCGFSVICSAVVSPRIQVTICSALCSDPSLPFAAGMPLHRSGLALHVQQSLHVTAVLGHLHCPHFCCWYALALHIK